MIFDISLRDFLKLKKVFSTTVNENKSSIMAYYEDFEDEAIHLYLPDQNVVYHTVFKKGQILFDEDGTEMSEESFRLSVLAGALELLSKPKELRISIEQ